MKKYLIFKTNVQLTLSLLIFILISIPPAVTGNITILSSSADELIIEFLPVEWKCDTLRINADSYLKFQFESAHFTSTIGQPAVPYTSFIIGAPANSKINYKIIDARFSRRQDALPAPVPVFKMKDSFPEEGYQIEPGNRQPFNENILSRSSFPSEFISVQAAGFLRNQPVARVNIFPIQCNLQQRTIKWYTRIVLRIKFQTSKPVIQQDFISEPDEALYSAALINYQQARKWRVQQKRQPPPPFAKKFSTGKWIKISVQNEGMYQLFGSQLAAHGINLAGIDPSRIRLFNNGGKALPESVNAERPDSLIENAILVFDGNDGRFDAEDYLVFYGRGARNFQYDPMEKRFTHSLHRYTNFNIYWINWGSLLPGKRIQTGAAFSAQNGKSKVSYRDFQFHEAELFNIIQSGRNWLGRKLRIDGEPINYSMSLQNAEADSPVVIRAQVAAVSFGHHTCYLRFNSLPVHTFSAFGSGNEYPQFNLKTGEIQTNISIHPTSNIVSIGYTVPQSSATCFVDWVEMEFTRNLVLGDDVLRFNSVPDSGVTQFRLQNPQDQAIQIFDVTEFQNVREINSLREENEIVFTDSISSEQPQRYLALNAAQYKQILEFETVTFNNIRDHAIHADYLIIAPTQFYEPAMTLKSMRENMDSLKTNVVTITDIFNEFGWGIPDPTAIRDFIRYAFNNGTPQPRYVLLLGDGHYDYKGIMNSGVTNWIPPYETTETYSGSSRCIDAWFTRVHGDDPYADLSIGRLPASSLAEARVVVDKICRYEYTPVYGEWRNTVTLIADDEYVQSGQVKMGDLAHTRQSETVSRLVPPHFNQQKIYLINYPAVNTASLAGITKPAVNEDIVRAINQGTVLVNMIGHSHERQFAHENVFSLSKEVPQLTNTAMLPFFVVPSCAFGRFDHPVNQFISESLLLKEQGGSIASLASARLANSDPNSKLNKQIFLHLFAAPSISRLGDVVRLAQNAFMNENTEKYNLLGDPALRLAFPQKSVEIKSIKPDSLHALSIVTVQGNLPQTSLTVSLQNGVVYMRVFDSAQNQTYLADETHSLMYLSPGKTIFRGSAKLEDNSFRAKFIVPKDISYGGKQGRVSCYFCSEAGDFDASGSYENLYVGGTAASIADTEGPEIIIGFKNCNFEANDYVNEQPVLLVSISDSLSGINLTGEIGHKITLILDAQAEQKQNLTPYFNYQKDSYLEGTIEYPLEKLSAGEHTIKIKAWDNFNNSSKQEASFTVVSDNKLILRNILNYPNPFSGSTNFTFEINQAAEISIKIFTLNGRLIRTFSQQTARQGFNFYLNWDGTDEYGDQLANGVYIYQICAETRIAGQLLKTSQIEKLIIMR